MNSIVRALNRMLQPQDEQSCAARKNLSSLFGPLELTVMETLWERSESLSVRALHEDFPDVAYTTLMTTLDRLYKKSALVRSKRGRAFLYQARLTRDEVQSKLTAGVFTTLLGGDVGTSLVLSSFIEAVGQRDEMLLDELEDLLRQRRAERCQK